MKLVGILGGTFNPIHNGHLHLAAQLLAQLPFDEIRFIPSAVPALKKLPAVSAQQRADMVALAIAHQPKLTLDTLELERQGVSYTIDTLKSLRQTLGNQVTLCLVMGYDAFLNLPKWHQWQALLEFAHIVVVNRPQSAGEIPAELAAWLKQHQTNDPALLKQHNALQANNHGGFGAVYFAHIAPMDISSSHIRHLLAQGESVNTLLPQNVMRYIEQHQLYTTHH